MTTTTTAPGTTSDVLSSSPSSPSHKPSSRPAVHTLTTESSILSALSALSADEASLDASLSSLLAARAPLDGALARVRALAPALNGLRGDAISLRSTVGATARTAERVGGRVKELDSQMGRVREAAERVAQVIELKSSLDALRAAIDAQDWETASRHCARAMAIPSDVLNGRFAEVTLATEDAPLPPSQTLEAARQELLHAFETGFTQASTARDAAATSRFFKLFPSIGFESEGLDAYGAFVVDLVRVRPPTSAKTSSPLYYITSLTALFESIARIVDQHAPVVEKYYGAGKMAAVLTRLLQDADRVVHSLLEQWAEERGLQRKMADTQATQAASEPGRPFSPAFGSNLNNSALSNTPGASPVVGPGGGPGGGDDELVDPREIDRVLSEAAGIAGRWALFRKFLWERLSDEDEDEDGDGNGDGDGNVGNGDVNGGVNASPGEDARVPNDKTPGVTEVNGGSDAAPGIQNGQPELPPGFEAVENCGCKKAIEHMLDTFYTPLETWYARTIIAKAQRLASPDTSTPHLGSTAPDDVFYILKVVLARVLGTGERAALEHTVAKLRDVLDGGYAAAVRRRLDDVYRASAPSGGGGGGITGIGGIGTIAGIGGGRGDRGERAERESRAAFVSLLNDLDVSSAHLARLVRDAQDAPALTQHFLPAEVPAVKAAVGSLNGVAATFKAARRAGVEQLFSQLVRPRLRTFIPDVYKDVSYLPPDSEGAHLGAGHGEVLRGRFARALEGVVGDFRTGMTEANFRLFFGLLLDVLVRPWEKWVMGVRFNELGAMRFDRDLRAITSHLAEQTAFGDVRDKFARLQQMSTLLNLDTEEDVAEFYNGSGINWKLSVQEAQAVAGLRV